MTRIEDANERAMARYLRTVTIELSEDEVLHVTRNGGHTINNIDEFAAALFAIVSRSAIARDIVPPPPNGVSYREFLNMAIGLNADGSAKS